MASDFDSFSIRRVWLLLRRAVLLLPDWRWAGVAYCCWWVAVIVAAVTSENDIFIMFTIAFISCLSLHLSDYYTYGDSIRGRQRASLQSVLLGNYCSVSMLSATADEKFLAEFIYFVMLIPIAFLFLSFTPLYLFRIDTPINAELYFLCTCLCLVCYRAFVSHFLEEFSLRKGGRGSKILYILLDLAVLMGLVFILLSSQLRLFIYRDIGIVHSSVINFSYLPLYAVALSIIFLFLKFMLYRRQRRYEKRAG